MHFSSEVRHHSSRLVARLLTVFRSCWYIRYEIQKRFSAFYLLALLASGFSNILAYGLSQMKGVGGLNGWRWIFIIVSHHSNSSVVPAPHRFQEGIITAVLGCVGYVAIVDFPDRATQPGLLIKKSFLTPEEAQLVLNRIDRDRGDAEVEKQIGRAHV